MQSFTIPKNVGGGFSVFCAVGLLPSAIVDIDVDELPSSAKKFMTIFLRYKNSFNINAVLSYSSRLEGFSK